MSIPGYDQWKLASPYDDAEDEQQCEHGVAEGCCCCELARLRADLAEAKRLLREIYGYWQTSSARTLDDIQSDVETYLRASDGGA